MSITRLTNARRKALPATPRSTKNGSRLRVAMASALPLTLAGIRSLVREQSELEVIEILEALSRWMGFISESMAEILVFDLDEWSSEENREYLTLIANLVPTIALTNADSAVPLRSALVAGVRGLLPHGVNADEIYAAIRAVSSGMTVISPDFASLLFRSQATKNSDDFEEMIEPLTGREHDVLALMAEGLLNKEIADRLRISEHTVKFHVSTIMGKLSASSRTEAVTSGVRRGLLVL